MADNNQAGPSASQQEAELGFGHLVIRSIVPGAKIFVNDEFYATTWVALQVRPGTYTVRVSKRDQETIEELVEVKDGEIINIQHELIRCKKSKEVNKRLDNSSKECLDDGLNFEEFTDKAAMKCPDRDVPFENWIHEFKRFAQETGISSNSTQLLDRVSIDPSVIDKDLHQSEYTEGFFKYLNSRRTRGRIASGRKLLFGIRDEYGVPAEIIVALLGMESDYGANIGDSRVLRSLTTLAHNGRRPELFCSELLAALRMIDSGETTPVQMIGSWAGAMGQPQFMPSTFLEHAVDGDGDGRIDIWKNRSDVLSSVANYLKSIGWRSGEIWGRQVKLPEGFDLYDAQLNIQKFTAEWHEKGVRKANGGELSRSKNMLGSIILPAGAKGPAFLVYHNFHVITEWNNSLNFALTVGLLADEIAGKGGLVGNAPQGDRGLSRSAVIAMQEDLRTLEYYKDQPDGMFGRQTRAAIRKFQRDHDLPADAYPTPSLIESIRNKVRNGSIPSQITQDEVRALQKDLELLGYDPGAVDGVMGQQTKNAIRDFQRDHDLPVDATPTPPLIEAIRVAAPKKQVGACSMSQDEVLLLQKGLASLRYYTGKVDGDLGPQTQEALRAFQRDEGLAETDCATGDLLVRIHLIRPRASPQQKVKPW